MTPASIKFDEHWRSFSVLGSEAIVESGASVTLKTGQGCPSYWFSGNSTIILGRSPWPNDGAVAETRAGWPIAMDMPSIQHFRSGFMIVSCLRYFGGLHANHFDSRADIYINEQRVDGFGLRVIPPEHSDYFHRIPLPTMPDVWPISGCPTIYAWPLQREKLSLSAYQQISVRIDPGVRWDIDYVAILARLAKLPPRVFLSHNWEDKGIARLLASKLTARGVGVWLDEAEIKLGDSVIQKIRAALDEVDYVAVLLSSHSIASTWVAKELDIAMNQEIENKRVKVLPIRLDDSDLPGFLKGKAYADLRRIENLENVLNAIEGRLQEW